MTKYSQQMVKGMLQLLSNCPAETAHLRKELLIAAKHILTTELRNRKASFSLKACVASADFGASDFLKVLQGLGMPVLSLLLPWGFSVL